MSSSWADRVQSFGRVLFALAALLISTPAAHAQAQTVEQVPQAPETPSTTTTTTTTTTDVHVHEQRAAPSAETKSATSPPASARSEPTRQPADVVNLSAGRVALPPLPSGFLEKRIGSVSWAYHDSDANIARELQGALGGAWRRVVGELGRDVSSEMTIRIARGPEDMQRLAPEGSPPPAYAVGVAYPSLGLIILSVVSPESWLPPDLKTVLTHELSHIALHRAVAGRPLPLWFVEGLATQQAGEQRLTRVRTLWEAAVAGEILPLDVVARHFPERPQQVNLAYAQSADFVRHLLQTTDDRSRLPRLLENVANGMEFERAVLTAYRIDLDYLEREWRQGLGERFRVLPLVLTGTALWGGIALLAIVAFARRRRQHHEKLARWAQEEAEAEQALATLARAPSVVAESAPSIEPRVLHVYAIPAHVREAGVPTIEHEGQRHTLH